MSQKEYEQLVSYLEGMIADGCQIVIGGHLLDWSDTKIPELLEKIKKQRQKEAALSQSKDVSRSVVSVAQATPPKATPRGR